jgi:phosphoglycerate dehydrogenase-like enzyme
MTRSTVAGAAATVAAAAIALAFIYKSRRRAFSSTDPLKVHVLRDLPPETRALLSKLLRSNVQISTGPQPPPPGGAHVLVAGFGKGGDAVLTMESAVGPATRAYLIPYAGVDPALLPALRKANLSCYNCHHNAPIAAELALSLCLAAAKQLVQAHRDLEQGNWTRRGLPLKGVPDDRQPLETLHSLTLEGGLAVILGIRGNIGSRVALGLAALGMEIVGTSSSLQQGSDPFVCDVPSSSASIKARVTVYPSSHLLDLLPRARCVVVCMPLTMETRGIIGKDAVDAMGPHCILVNVGRGGVCDGAAVHEALSDPERRHLFAFASDVRRYIPLPSLLSPFFATPFDSRRRRSFARSPQVWYKYPSTFDEADGRCPPTVEGAQGAVLNFASGQAALYTTLSGHRGGAPGLKDTETRRWRALAAAFNYAADQGDPESMSASPSGLVGRVDLERGF